MCYGCMEQNLSTVSDVFRISLSIFAGILRTFYTSIPPCRRVLHPLHFLFSIVRHAIPRPAVFSLKKPWSPWHNGTTVTSQETVAHNSNKLVGPRIEFRYYINMRRLNPRWCDYNVKYITDDNNVNMTCTTQLNKYCEQFYLVGGVGVGVGWLSESYTAWCPATPHILHTQCILFSFSLTVRRSSPCA